MGGLDREYVKKSIHAAGEEQRSLLYNGEGTAWSRELAFAYHRPITRVDTDESVRHVGREEEQVVVIPEGHTEDV